MGDDNLNILCPHDMNGNEVNYDENGMPFSIDRHTGEVHKLSVAYMKPGDVAYSKEAREARKKRVERERLRERIQKANQKKSRFLFTNTAEKFTGLSPASVVRLIVLGTYADYECALRLDNHVPMAYKNLQSVLQIGRTAVNDFWREVSPVYVIEKNGALFLTDRAAFHRGKLIDTDRRWMKIYDNSVRALYRAADRSKHKHLGHVFKMLRYINVQHNILCRNPMEKDREHIVPITFGQFCELAGYDTSQCSRLISYFMGIKFRVGDHEEHFCKFVTNRKCLSYSWIFINPNVLYSGTDPESVGNFAVLSRSPDSDGFTQE